MTIKYCEITIINNNTNNNIFKNISTFLFGETEYLTHKKSDIIILFDDNTICNIDDNVKSFNYTFLESILSPLPIYFDKTVKPYPTYFKKNSKIDEDAVHRLNVDSIFPSELKKKYKIVPSIFNCMYYTYKDEGVFSILKLFSNNEKPRFLLAYNTKEFSKEEIMYLVNCIFRNKYKENE